MNIISLPDHARDMLILPFTIAVTVPFWIYNRKIKYIPNNILMKILALLLLLCGTALFSSTLFLFQRIGKGNLAPWTEKERLVLAGPYRYRRNPMISGVIFILTG